MSRKHSRKTSPAAGSQTKPVIPRHGWRVAGVVMVALLVGAALAVQRARRSSPAQPPALALAGFEPAIVSQIQNAIAELHATPRSGSVWGRLGMILQAHEFNTEAQFAFEQAERLDPKEPRWPYLHALMLRDENLGRSIQKLQRASKLHQDGLNIPRLRLGQTLFEAGRFDEAEKHFRELLRGNAHHAPARLAFAELNQARGRLAESQQLLQSCLSNSHTARRAHLLLCHVERRRGNSAVSEAAFRRAYTIPADSLWPDDYGGEVAQYRIGRKAWAEQAQQCLDQGRTQEAQALIRRLTTDYPEAPEGWLLLGRAHLKANDCAKAEQSFRRVLQLEPNSVNGLAQVGAALLCQQRHAEAIPVFQQALRLKPDFAEAHFNLGLALAWAGRTSEAVEPFRNAIRHSPNLVDPHITLADLLIQSGEREEARSLLHRVLQLNPADERAKILLQRVQP